MAIDQKIKTALKEHKAPKADLREIERKQRIYADLVQRGIAKKNVYDIARISTLHFVS